MISDIYISKTVATYGVWVIKSKVAKPARYLAKDTAFFSKLSNLFDGFAQIFINKDLLVFTNIGNK